MVAYCNDCKVYVNQSCDKCHDGFGISVCEKYACGGTMRCPSCNGTNLSKTKEFGADPYDYTRKVREARDKGISQPALIGCTCGFKLKSEWKYCPMCGTTIKRSDGN
jgi:hypothetical protein